MRQTTGYFALERAYGEPRDLQDFLQIDPMLGTT